MDEQPEDPVDAEADDSLVEQLRDMPTGTNDPNIVGEVGPTDTPPGPDPPRRDWPEEEIPPEEEGEAPVP